MLRNVLVTGEVLAAPSKPRQAVILGITKC